MILTATAISVPLRSDVHGTIRVGDSRVSLDVVIREFKNGAEAESIVRAYSTLQLADVYAVIAYYLQNRQLIEDYLEARRAEAEKLRQEIETNQPEREAFRKKLLTRREQMEQENASAGK